MFSPVVLLRLFPLWIIMHIYVPLSVEQLKSAVIKNYRGGLKYSLISSFHGQLSPPTPTDIRGPLCSILL